MSAADVTEAVIVAGRRTGDGFLRLAVFTRELLELTVEAHGERASTLLLTRAQINELQQTLTHLGAQLSVGDAIRGAEHEDAALQEHGKTEPWSGTERRNTGSLGKN